MRRSIFSTAVRPSRSFVSAQVNCSRRAFASSGIGSKDTTPPTPVEPSQEQAHPIGAFYEAILRSPPFIPEIKPEAAPVSSAPDVVAQRAERPKPTPITPTPAQPKPVEPKKAAASPAEQQPKTEEAKPAPTKTKASAAAPKEPATAAPVKEAPAKRTRAKKTKSVVSDPESSSLSPTSSVPPSSSKPTTTIISSPTSSALPSSSVPPPVTSSSTSTSESESAQKSNAPPLQQSDHDPPTITGESRARVIFGRPSLAGPVERAERLAAIRTRSRMVAGVLVPPRPEEPDNCCMSGCVNCVWERYRDELEEWAAAEGEAERRLMAREAGVGVEGEGEGVDKGTVESVDASMAAADRKNATAVGVGGVSGSMDDDGGGSETNWSLPLSAQTSAAARSGPGKSGDKEFWNEELYKNVPVGIREFMKQEKKLKEKHLREGTVDD